ncbi:MAG TPA: YcxB family protein [Candidatus Limnocylindrales bacterium]
MTNTEPPFTVTFELTTEDLVDYLRVAQKSLNTIGMAAGVVGMLYGAYMAWTGDVVVGGVLVAMGAFLILVSATRYADRLRARSVGKRIIGTQATITFDDGGIASSTAGGSGHASWAAVDNIMESPETLVLRRGRLTKLWLPKRALGTPAERDALLDYIRAHVSRPGA